MMCVGCKSEKNEPLSYWDRFKMWSLAHLWGEEYTDAKADSFTKGFGEGYVKGMEAAKEIQNERPREPDPIPLDFQVDLHDVFEVTKDRNLRLGGRVLSHEEIANFKVEAATLSRLRLWGIIQESLKQKAIEKSVLQSQTWEEVLGGKLMLHSLGIQRSILEVIREYKLEGSG